MKILLLDIETAPNIAHVWGLWNQNIGTNQILDAGYVMCWAAKWYGDDHVYFAGQHDMEEEDMLHECWRLLDEADAVVHYNGAKFDIPTLNKEFLLHGVAPPDPYHQIDLLRTARKRFRFPSNKLDYIAKALGLEGKVEHAGHQLWIDCMNNDPAAWKKMQEYNIQDVILLEDVYDAMRPWIQQHPNHALYIENPEAPVCPNCGSTHIVKKGIETTATMQYQRYRCQDCQTPLRGRTNIMDKEHKAQILVQSKI